jgi:hypothetical protein
MAHTVHAEDTIHPVQRFVQTHDHGDIMFLPLSRSNNLLFELCDNAFVYSLHDRCSVHTNRYNLLQVKLCSRSRIINNVI